MRLALAALLLAVAAAFARAQPQTEAHGAQGKADLCLSPALLDRFLAQESAYDLRGFLAEISTDSSDRVCQRVAGRLCFRKNGVFALWSNNAAAVWVGPLIGGAEELRYVEGRLAALTDRARSLTAAGDYAGAAAGRVSLREGECFAPGGVSGRADPQILYAIGREAVRLDEARSRLEGLRAEASRPAAGATDELLRDIGAAATAEVDAAFGAEPGQPASQTLPLGRAADGLLRVLSSRAASEEETGRRIGAAVAAEMPSRDFARWLVRVTEIGLTATDIASSERPVVARLALLGYLRAPNAFEALAAWMASARPSEDSALPADYFRAIAAEFRALDALAGFADAWRGEGPLRKIAEDVAAFARSLPESERARLSALPTGALFALSDASESLPPVTELQRLALAGLRQAVIADRTADVVSALGRSGLAFAVQKLAAETGLALAPEKIADHLADAEHAALAGRILRAALLQAFAENSATMQHIEALAAGRFDDFAAALLETVLQAGLAGPDNAVAVALAGPLAAGRPYEALRAGLEQAGAGLAPAQQRGLIALIDGRAGAAARRILRAALEGASLSAAEAEAVLAGNAAMVLERRLARATGLSEAQLSNLRDGEAADYVRRRAASALAGTQGASTMLDALESRPRPVLAAERQRIEADLLSALDPQARAATEGLAGLAEPAARREVAAIILASEIGHPQLAATAVMRLLFAGDRGGAAATALTPLLTEIPGGEALVAGDVAPYRRSVASALREAAAGALGEAAARRLLDEAALARLREGDVEALGRRYAAEMMTAAGLDPQTRAQLLAGEEAAAWRHEGRVRAIDGYGRIPADRRIELALWRMQAAIDLTRRALARQRLIHGVALPGETGSDADRREMN